MAAILSKKLANGRVTVNQQLWTCRHIKEASALFGNAQCLKLFVEGSTDIRPELARLKLTPYCLAVFVN